MNLFEQSEFDTARRYFNQWIANLEGASIPDAPPIGALQEYGQAAEIKPDLESHEL